MFCVLCFFVFCLFVFVFVFVFVFRVLCFVFCVSCLFCVSCFDISCFVFRVLCRQRAREQQAEDEKQGHAALIIQVCTWCFCFLNCQRVLPFACMRMRVLARALACSITHRRCCCCCCCCFCSCWWLQCAYRQHLARQRRARVLRERVDAAVLAPASQADLPPLQLFEAIRMLSRVFDPEKDAQRLQAIAKAILRGAFAAGNDSEAALNTYFALILNKAILPQWMKQAQDLLRMCFAVLPHLRDRRNDHNTAHTLLTTVLTCLNQERWNLSNGTRVCMCLSSI